MHFKKITFDDMPSIIPFLNNQRYRSCDFTALGVYLWIDAFSYEFAIDNDCLFMREVNADGYKYLAPLSNKYSAKEAFDFLLFHLKSEGQKSVTFTLLPQAFLQEVGLNIDDCVYQRDFSDYVYNAEDLKELKGRAYSKKRNLIHQFLSTEPNYKFIPLLEVDKNAYADFIKNIKIGTQGLALYENERLMDVTQKLSDLNLLSYALIEGNQKVIGICFGEVIGDTFYVHIEKANTDYKGAYQMINNLFVKEVYATHPFTYVNREDDVGDDGLRQAKLSYNPVFLTNKYKVTIEL